MNRIRVMLIEDDSFTRTTIKAALQLQGIEIIHDTGSVGSAMKIASAAKPDAAVIDLDLGTGPNGIDLALGLRRVVPGIGIVLLTGFMDPRFLDPKVAHLPPGSRYVIKHKVHEIEILHYEIKKAIEGAGSKTDTPQISDVTGFKIPDAQIETLKFVANGLSNSEIAKLRDVSEKSVEQAISRLVAQFKINGSAQNKRVELSRIYFRYSGSVPNPKANE